MGIRFSERPCLLSRAGITRPEKTTANLPGAEEDNTGVRPSDARTAFARAECGRREEDGDE